MFLEISQKSQENTCVRTSFLIKLQTEACNFIKKETLAQFSSCEFCKIAKNNFLQNTSGRLLLFILTLPNEAGLKVFWQRLIISNQQKILLPLLKRKEIIKKRVINARGNITRLILKMLKLIKNIKELFLKSLSFTTHLYQPILFVSYF